MSSGHLRAGPTWNGGGAGPPWGQERQTTTEEGGAVSSSRSFAFRLGQRRSLESAHTPAPAPPPSAAPQNDVQVQEQVQVLVLLCCPCPSPPLGDHKNSPQDDIGGLEQGSKPLRPSPVLLLVPLTGATRVQGTEPGATSCCCSTRKLVRPEALLANLGPASEPWNSCVCVCKTMFQ